MAVLYMGIRKQKKIKSISLADVNWALREFLSEINQLSKSPRGVLALCTCYIELIVNSLIKAKCKTGASLLKKEHIPLKSKVLLLYEIGTIDSVLYDDMSLLIDERNKAAHEFDYNFDYEMIKKFNYLKKATNKIELNETNASQTPWIKICFHILSEIADSLKKIPP
jgi:hypothetical protein